VAKRRSDRILIRLRSSESGHVHHTEKNRRSDAGRLELRRYDPLLRRHALYRETR
jgi:large subunit ribosomal protein L33